MRIVLSLAWMCLAVVPSMVTDHHITRRARDPQPIFDEEFNGSTLNTGVWTALDRAGDYGNKESECYKPANVQVSGGYLVITSEAQRLLCGDVTHSKTGFAYSSGMVQWSNFSFTYGTIEVRAKTAGGQGSWPALWLLGANCQVSNVLTADNIGTCNWPNRGSQEIDLLEMDYSLFTNVYHNLFNGNSYFCQQTTSDTSQNWHVYRMNWSATQISFSIDGQTAATSFRSGVPTTPMFLIMNNAMGGLGGNIVSSNFPQTMLVDYVRVYSQ